MSSLTKLSAPGPCIYYTGAINKVNGYGHERWDGRQCPAHRAALLRSGRPIPAGYDVDHVCHSADLTCPGGPDCLHRRCVNPAHLEAVTRAENLRRAAARITHCPHGHAYTAENTIHNVGGRQCRTCKRAQDLRRNRRHGMQPHRADRATHCVNGHEYTPENTAHQQHAGRRSRKCRTCDRMRAAARRAERRAS